MSAKSKSDRLRRIVMTVAGVSASGIAVSFFNYSAFGMDPFQVLAHGLWNLTPLSYGTFYTIFSLILFIFVFMADRKKIGLGTVINMFLLGYITEFFSWLLARLFPDGGLFLRLIMLIIGITIMCLAAALYFTANMGVSVYDAVALCLSERTPIKFQFCRMGSDVICVAVGFFFGAQVGLGTIITMFFTGPLIHIFQETLAIPLIRGRNPVAYSIRKLYLSVKKALRQKSAGRHI